LQTAVTTKHFSGPWLDWCRAWRGYAHCDGRRINMKSKALYVLAAAATMFVTLVIGFGVMAAAQPAGGQEGCEAAGGVFDDKGTAARSDDTCTIVTVAVVEDTVPASHPQQAWTVDVETIVTTTTVYSRGAVAGVDSWINPVVTPVPGATEVVACYNHLGNAIPGFNSNPNCQPAQ
jgi:hypothetical protein